MSDRVYDTNFESFPCLVSHAILLFLKKRHFSRMSGACFPDTPGCFPWGREMSRPQPRVHVDTGLGPGLGELRSNWTFRRQLPSLSLSNFLLKELNVNPFNTQNVLLASDYQIIKYPMVKVFHIFGRCWKIFAFSFWSQNFATPERSPAQ